MCTLESEEDPRQIHRYVQLDWPDMNAASKLCIIGICRYKAKPRCGVIDNWLANESAPGITLVSFDPGVGKILGAVLLWGSYDALMIELVPGDILLVPTLLQNSSRINSS